MAKINKPETETSQKTQTKYDRKIEERKLAKEKELKQKKISKITGIILAIVLVAAVAVSIAIPVINKNSALNDTYVKIGSHDLTKLEYDYYYNTTVNNYITNYSSIIPYLGIDVNTDFDKQQYSEDMTWKDMFDEMTMQQLQQVKVMSDAGKADTSFDYDVSEEYNDFVKKTEESAEASELTIKELYKKNFGQYATADNVKPFIEESLYSGAYYEKLMEDNAPTDEVIKAYYETNKKDYDKVDYRNFAFTSDEIKADTSEEDTKKIMDELKTKADAMMEARKSGSDFDELCAENATEDEKANYEDKDSEYCLTEGGRAASMSTLLSDWLYDDTRKEGDITVLEDEATHRYYVVEFVKKYFDEADNETISNTLAGKYVSEFINSLLVDYEVTDVKGDMNYLKVAQANAEKTPEAESIDNTDNTDNTESAE